MPEIFLFSPCLTLDSAYYMELGLGIKKKKHGQLPSVKEMFKWRTKTSYQEE
jgi:hypothetical protein